MTPTTRGKRLRRLGIAVLVTTTGLLVLACFLPSSGRPRPDGLSLSFRRYSDFFDAHAGDDVAFLWLTNVSSQPYLLYMPGRTNTIVMEPSFGPPREKMSWRVNCEFREQTPTGWTNWAQLPSSIRTNNVYLSLAPRSGIQVRVPLPTNGHRCQVAVLCERPSTTSSFWISPLGFRLFRALPQSLKTRILNPKPQLLKVWCDQELSLPRNPAREH